MRILHTSDWHLGRTLHGVDLMAHQAAYVDHLVDLARSADVDAVLVAGDVYDRAVPPVDAVALLSDAVARLAEHAAVVLTPGNHDSAIRLGFGADLMRPGIHVRARIPAVAEPVLLAPRRESGSGLAVYALPYLDPDAARWALADEVDDARPHDPTVFPELAHRADLADLSGSVAGRPGTAPTDGEAVGAVPRSPLARSHEAVTAAAMRRVGADLGRRRAADRGLRSVVMAHTFVVGGPPSESERDIRVGGVDCVPAGVFGGWGVDYVALGHLHGPQAVTVPHVQRGTPAASAAQRGTPATAAAPRRGTPTAPATPTRARYCGSPLAYSFSEMHQRKSSVLLDLDAGTEELIPTPVPRRLAEVTGTLEDLLGESGRPYLDDWLRVVVTDEHRPPELYARVKARFAHVLQVTHRPPQRTGPETIAVVGPGRDPLEVTHDFVRHVTGHAPTPPEAAVLRGALEAVLAAERSA